MERHLELLADAKLKIIAVYQAFGRPGDYGYSTKEGNALASLYDLHNEISDALKPAEAPVSQPAAESGDIGYGATEAEAIADFRENYQDEADLRLDGECACPYCFESSGYVWEHGNDWESGPWSHQTNIPCQHCNGTGLYSRPVVSAPQAEEIPF